jgi:hypothetical protein
MLIPVAAAARLAGVPVDTDPALIRAALAGPSEDEIVASFLPEIAASVPATDAQRQGSVAWITGGAGLADETQLPLSGATSLGDDAAQRDRAMRTTPQAPTAPLLSMVGRSLSGTLRHV